MKKLTSYLFLTLLPILFATCSDSKNDNCEGMLWDFFNYEIVFSAIDADSGQNLFDPKNPNNLLDGGVWVTYKDKRYDVVNYKYPEADTRATYVRPFALRHYPADVPGGYNKLDIGFGEFAPGSYKGELFTIHWADGSSDEVKLDCYITWHDCDPTIHKALYLNGEKISDTGYPTLSFVKEGANKDR